MPAFEDCFEREHGCSDAEWRGWLPQAAHGHRLVIDGTTAAVTIGAGTLRFAWHALPPRCIGRLQLPRLAVSYRFDGVDAPTRAAFMKRFDLHLQRGGG